MPYAVQAHVPMFEAAGAAHDIDPRLLAIHAFVESSGNPKAKSPTGARGLMQILPSTAKYIAALRGLPFSAKMLYDPRVNVDYGAWYLKRQLNAFKSVRLAAAAYNGGPTRVRKWMKGKRTLSTETQRYMRLVDALWAERDAATSETLALRKALRNNARRASKKVRKRRKARRSKARRSKARRSRNR